MPYIVDDSDVHSVQTFQKTITSGGFGNTLRASKYIQKCGPEHFKKFTKDIDNDPEVLEIVDFIKMIFP